MSVPSSVPYPQFGQVDYKDAISTTNFNGWQTSLQRQFRNGFSLQFNYLFSHSINDGTTGGGESDYANNDKCLGCEYASSDQDVRHSISSDAIYTLPFGRGQQFLSHGLLGFLLGGISLNTVYTFRSGLPINVVLDRPANRPAAEYSRSAGPRCFGQTGHDHRCPGRKQHGSQRGAAQPASGPRSWS